MGASAVTENATTRKATTQNAGTQHEPLGPPRAEPTARHTISVEVNGEAVTAEVESRLLLTDFLRHRLRLTGTHVGCEQGACGACTIQLDGQPVRSCLMLAAQVDGRSIRTIEGLAAPGEDLSPVQQAFADQHGLQCGFCTPGFVMSVTSLREQVEATGAAATEAEIQDCVDSSYCRCTGYVNIRKAARQALGVPVEVAGTSQSEADESEGAGA